jgi:hypothetical protein
MTSILEFREAATEGDTFAFRIVNEDPDPKRTVGGSAVNTTGDKIKVWIAARLIAEWDRMGTPPKTVIVEVKVGVEYPPESESTGEKGTR